MISFASGPIANAISRWGSILGGFLFAVGLVGYFAACIEERIRKWQDKRYERQVLKEINDERSEQRQ